eukprot:GDKI01032148.1.p1 GENE.GDKI01032148.1~~GDKI01032148.1.p1  ORF type:complete len:753 (+),score=208.49 GDKI01032148.1:158-2416(+)
MAHTPPQRRMEEEYSGEPEQKRLRTVTQTLPSLQKFLEDKNLYIYEELQQAGCRNLSDFLLIDDDVIEHLPITDGDKDTLKDELQILSGKLNNPVGRLLRFLAEHDLSELQEVLCDELQIHDLHALAESFQSLGTQWLLDRGVKPLQVSRLSKALRDVPPVVTDKTNKVILDSVHGFMEVEKWLFQFVDTPHVQRLRHLKQLGACQWVWPTATHSRFEHSLGVSYMGLTLFDRLASKCGVSLRDPEIQLYRSCVGIAGLCHDLGHGPFSHTFEYALINRGKPKSQWWHHEHMSSLMLEDMIENYMDGPAQEVWAENKELIKLMMEGDDKRKFKKGAPYVPPVFADEYDELKHASVDIIANKKNGIDVDKMDYLQRDALVAGFSKAFAAFDPSRLQHFCSVVGGEICYNHKEHNQVWLLYDNRYKMFKQLYSHRKVRAHEYMICDALREVDKIYGLTSATEDVKKYLLLDDRVLWSVKQPYMYEQKDRQLLSMMVDKFGKESDQVREYEADMRDTHERVARAQQILGDMEKRKIYKFAREAVVTSSAKIKHYRWLVNDKYGWESLHNKVAACCAGLSPDDIIVDLNELNYGTGGNHPYEIVRFYSPNNERKNATELSSALMGQFPAEFQELQLRIFVKDPSKLDMAKSAFEKFLQEEGIGEDTGPVEGARRDVPHLPPSMINSPYAKATSEKKKRRLERTGGGTHLFAGEDSQGSMYSSQGGDSQTLPPALHLIPPAAGAAAAGRPPRPPKHQ